MILSGTNQVHGKFYEYFQNRYLNAQDEAFKRQGTSQRTRYDQNLLGANLGGPLKRDRAFYFGSLDYNPLGRNSTSGTPRYAPTAAGYPTLSSNPLVSQTNLSVFKEYLGSAPAQTGSLSALVRGGRSDWHCACDSPKLFEYSAWLRIARLQHIFERSASRSVCAESDVCHRYRGAGSCFLDATPDHSVFSLPFRDPYVRSVLDERNSRGLQSLQ